MLVNLNYVLPNARKERYAVPAFDTDIRLLIKPTLEAAEEMHSPVILQFHEIDVEGKDMNYVTSLVKVMATQSNVPVVLHLDHGENLEKIKRAIDNGFTSVMYDGSHLSLEENIRNTRDIVEYATRYDVTVEAELGHVGGSDLDFNDTGESLLTNPEDVKKFIDETGVHALAVSIGTSHGVYKAEPELNIEVLKNIAQVTDIPLVIHGGSGTPKNQLKVAIMNGITKVNVFADLRLAFKKGMENSQSKISRPDPLPAELYEPIFEEIKKVVKSKIQAFGSENKGN